MQLIAVFAVQSCSSGLGLFAMLGSGSVCLLQVEQGCSGSSMALSFYVL